MGGECDFSLSLSLYRLLVDRVGRVTYSHERDPGWDVNQLTHSRQQEGLTPRDIYWRYVTTVSDHCSLSPLSDFITVVRQQ